MQQNFATLVAPNAHNSVIVWFTNN